MRITDELAYPVPPDAVARMLADRDFVAEKCRAMLATGVEVTVEGDRTGAFTVTSSRVQPTDQVPESLRRFAGDGLTIRQVDVWQAPTGNGVRIGSVEVEIVGLPVRFSGSMALEPVSGGSSQSVDGELKASVPLIGGKVEQAAAPAIEGAIRQEHRSGLTWLTEHPIS